MEAKEASRQLDSMRVLDVREYYEWAAGHIEGALHLPLRQLPHRFEEVERDRPILVTCQVGQRSALATEFLRERGYDAHNLEGGVAAWVAEGLTLVDPSNEEGMIVDGWAQTLE